MSPLLVAPCRELPVAPSTDAILQPVFGVPERHEQRSGCPINLSLEIFGDRWSLIVIRDMMFGNRRHFRELLSLEPKKLLALLSGLQFTKQDY
jgi:hypothetical protein